MVDCADRDRIDEARQELHRIINDREMRDAIILIFANKQDLPEGKSYSWCWCGWEGRKQKSDKMEDYNECNAIPWLGVACSFIIIQTPLITVLL